MLCRFSCVLKQIRTKDVLKSEFKIIKWNGIAEGGGNRHYIATELNGAAECVKKSLSYSQYVYDIWQSIF